jgi:3'-phosphoadenosine 5'-phosphosulfate sulfotransferase (PAPS reductase)/FAD synthetase
MKYILSLSFGKDSMALLLEVLKRKMPLDYVIYCDIKYNNEISANHPLMAEWIPKAEKILKEKFGVEVLHLYPNKTFEEQFYTQKEKGKHKGDIYGYPYSVGSWCNDRLKLQPIKQFLSKVMKEHYCITEYVGIAKDEHQRLDRYKSLETENHKYITLADLDISEKEATEICKKHNLLSPIYDNAQRGGCWFCIKQSSADLYELYTKYPHLFNKLVEIEKDSINSFTPRKTIRQIKEEFDAGKLPRKRNFDKNKRYETVKGNINKYKNMWNKLKEFVENKMETSNEAEWYTLEEIQLKMRDLEE